MILKSIPNFPVQTIEQYWFKNILFDSPKYLFQETVLPLCITENQVVLFNYDKTSICLLWIKPDNTDLIKCSSGSSSIKDITIQSTKNSRYTKIDKQDYVILSFIKNNKINDFTDYIHYIKYGMHILCRKKEFFIYHMERERERAAVQSQNPRTLGTRRHQLTP